MIVKTYPIQQITDSFNLLPDAVLIVDEKGTIINHNEQTLKILGYESGKLMGQNLNIILPQRFKERHDKFVEDFFSQGITRKMGVGRKLWAVKKDGVEIDVDIALSVVKQDQNSYTIAVLRDISDKIHINDRDGGLEKLRDEMKRFAYVVSHDLKSPLQRIKALAHLISLGLPEKKSNEITKMVAYLNDSIHSMEKLIHGVIEYEQMEYKEENSNVDLNTVLDEITRTINIPEQFKIIRSNDLPIVKGNYTKLLQVFLNLITNTIKYNTKPEGILKIDWVRVDTMFLFRFSDNGVSIPSEYQEKIFHLFERVSTIENNSHGVGLSIVKRIVEGAGGRVWYEDSSLGGSCFCFTWPG